MSARARPVGLGRVVLADGGVTCWEGLAGWPGGRRGPSHVAGSGAADARRRNTLVLLTGLPADREDLKSTTYGFLFFR